MPLGQLPLLKVDDKTLVQSMAIARYIAREFGMYNPHLPEFLMRCHCHGSVEWS